ncbi:DUF4232 domain-containing protein [Streptomyces sp. NRRL WC-3742]|uniref:DUF4232 domain-containing protein n=1 Tax=Streptomyces sp. NRRL WC-3742 TaxID=1463934 RepID=UPI0004C4CFD9|nr:DUF4232 domain-containing protein [Streptomyces sp. NRRL WC-3742]
MRVHKVTFAALAVAAGLALTACQNDDASTDQSKPTAAPTVTTAPSAPPAPSTPSATSPATSSAAPKGTAAPTGSADGGKAGGKCRTDDLTITAVDRTIDGDAERTVVVELKNRSGHDCSLSGYAGVDLKTSAGTLSATRSGEPVVAGVVKSGKSTFFGITYPNNKSGGTGVRVTGVVVTPPDETKPVTLPWPGAATLPVTEGGGTPVKIGPMGSAGQGN